MADDLDKPLTRRELRLAAEARAGQDEHGTAPKDDRVSAGGDGADQPEADPVATPGAAPRERSLLAAIFNGVLVAVLIAIMAIAAAAIVVPAATGATALTVLTSSMEPTLPGGTLIVIRPTDPEEIVPGTVMTYQLRSGEPEVVTHRVTQQLRTADGTYRFITQGDANPTPDVDPVGEVQVRGTLWYAIPYVGWVSSALSGSWRAWVVPLAVAALFGYAAFMVISSVRDRGRKRRESVAA